MHESEIIEPVDIAVDYAAGYSMPEVYLVTAHAVLYRVRKAGKYFIIKTPKESGGQAIAMLQREYELSLGKSHPHIVNVFTYEQCTIVGPGIVMEYVDGRTLTAFLAENPSKAMRCRVFEQLLQAVAYIHRSGVVHNDIKPENILVTRAGNDVRLIDFGLADDDAHYLARTPGCTPAYASPEKDIDVRSDVYSLGVILCRLFPNKYSRIAARCLCAQKEKRYSNAEQLLAAFRHRNRPAMLFLSVLALIPLLLLLLSGYFTSLDNSRKITVQQTVVEQKIAVRDSFLAQVEKDVTAIYESVADSISSAPYYEFATNNIISFYEIMGEYNKEKI
ncbi:MAG: serine/threonine protein kinase, partial [Bacteroidaceae bacterium]|nr:serine/threonine protein kinase [Bacteroidaceae bacterium]